MNLTRYRPSRNIVFGFLLALSALSLKLPPAFSDGLKHIGHYFVPFQSAAYDAARAATASVADVDESSRIGELTRERDALAFALLSQSSEVDRLTNENTRLSAIRTRVMPEPVPLQPARVVGRDIVAARDAVLIGRGKSRNVAYRDWVASRFFIDRGAAAGLESEQAVFAREALLGRVELVSSYMARVQLLSDIDSTRIEVRIGRVVDSKGGELEIPLESEDPLPMRQSRLVVVDYVCSLRGKGGGRMVVEDVPHRYLQGLGDNEPGDAHRRVKVGDLVFSAPGQFGIPVSMVVGKVIEIQQKPEKRLVADVVVAPVVDIDRLQNVWVIPSTPAGGTAP